MEAKLTDLVNRLKEQHPEQKIIVLSDFENFRQLSVLV